MYTDFYVRYEDKNVVQDIIEINDELSLLITQIEMCLFTNKYDLIGQPTFGINLEELLFTFDTNELDIKSKLLKVIYDYCPLASKYYVNIEVKFQAGDIRDLALIEIIINNKTIFGITL